VAQKQNKKGISERKGILQFMKNCIDDPDYNKAVSGNKRVMSLIEKLFDYLDFYYDFKDFDEINKDNKHHKRFEFLYRKKSDMTFFEISEEMSLSTESDTFKYHVRNYNYAVFRYIRQKSKADPDYAFLLNEYCKSRI